MKLCEKCGDLHSGEYGSGRFCSVKCAKTFSSITNREETNRKVSEKLKGRVGHGKGFQKGFDPRRVSAKELKEASARGRETQRMNRAATYASSSWDDLPGREKRRRVLLDQNGQCLWCGASDWRGLPISLELDHINGSHHDNRRENLRYLCPNCHSQTPTFRNKKRTSFP